MTRRDESLPRHVEFPSTVQPGPLSLSEVDLPMSYELFDISI